MLNDFISGALACLNTENAVKHTIDYINANPEDKVIYVCDNHPISHISFARNGGLWPNHCVEGTFGGCIHAGFF